MNISLNSKTAVEHIHILDSRNPKTGARPVYDMVAGRCIGQLMPQVSAAAMRGLQYWNRGPKQAVEYPEQLPARQRTLLSIVPTAHRGGVSNMAMDEDDSNED